MTTALVLGSESLDSPGGMESVCRQQVQALGESGLETEYVAMSEVSRPTAFDRTLGPLLRAKELRTHVKTRPPADVVVSNGPVGWGICGAQVSVHFYHGTYAGQAAAIRGSISLLGSLRLRLVDAQLLERNAGRGKKCFANSVLTAREVEKYFGLETQVVGCPVDMDKFSPAASGESSLSPGKPAGIFVGAGRPMKGEVHAYALMRTLPDIQWLVIGEHPAAELPPNASLRERVSPEEMPDLLRSADLLLATPVYEPFGLVIVEALACGTPVVTTPAGAADVILGDQKARSWYVEAPRDELALKTSVEGILSHPVEARETALRLRAKLQRDLAGPVWRRRFADAVLTDGRKP